MSLLSDFRARRGRLALTGLRCWASQAKGLRFAMLGKAVFAVIFSSTATLLFAQEQPVQASRMAQDMFQRAMAQAASATAISHQVKDIFDRAAKAVVKIHGVDEHSPICGTGFFIDPTGTLYTAYTVGGEAEDFTIEFNGRKYPARQLVKDLRSGIAMLKIDAATPALTVGRSDEMDVATPVVAVGYPLDLPETPNFGLIGGLDRKYLGQYFSTVHLRANVPTQRGEAGSPLMNMKGEVVGIVVAGIENNSACYAVPIEAAEKIRSDFVRFGEVRDGWIGVSQVLEASKPTEGSRVEITQIVDGAPAAKSGMKRGDILLQLGQKKIARPEDVIDASFYVTAGDVVPVTVMRGDEKLNFNVRADLHPDNHRANPLIHLSLSSEAPPPTP
jgi:S1-C subfamily serine protease